MKANGHFGHLHNRMQPSMGHAVVQSRKLRVLGGASLLQFAGLSLRAGSLLPVGVCARAQEPTKHQENDPISAS
jgi:hypothetical protein